MIGLTEKLKNKVVHIAFIAEFFRNGGIAAAEYLIKDCTDGFLEMRDERGRTVFCRLDQIKQITVMPDTALNGGTIGRKT